MSNIISVVTSLIAEIPNWVENFLGLCFVYGQGSTKVGPPISDITWVGLFVVILPLVGLGIGIIRRLVRIRA